MTFSRSWLLGAVLVVASGCRTADPPASTTGTPATTATTTAAAKADKPADKTADPHAAHAAGVAVGAPAPDFTLADLDGKSVHLADHKGKRVVLEWFNPECPYVKNAHSKGSLREYAGKATKDGVVWLAINSAAAGKQGFGPEVNRKGKDDFKLAHPVLLDTDGKVGHAYGATNTPHMFVIDEKGVVVYRGAIDNSPDGEGKEPTGGTLVNYVEAALADLAAGRPVKTPETRAYGCGVKFASMLIRLAAPRATPAPGPAGPRPPTRRRRARPGRAERSPRAPARPPAPRRRPRGRRRRSRPSPREPGWP
ncbi:MAG: thioredoxin family protein [Myxococcales bacterium]|nr:MAG: thioredoxin family protein [Myxococcales bacterium]